MIQPLDFSSRQPVSPTQQPRRRRPGGSRRRSLLLGGAVIVVGSVAAVLVLGVFDDDGRKEAQDLARYCQLVDDVDRVARDTGATSAPGVYDGSPEQLRAAATQLAGSFDELRSLAPASIRSDVAALVDWLQAARRDGAAVKAADVAGSAMLVNQHRAGTCASASGTSFGD